MSTPAATASPRRSAALTCAEALGAGSSLLPGIAFATWALTHPSQSQFLLPLVLFFTASKAAPFASRAIGRVHNPLGVARLSLILAAVGALSVVVCAWLASPAREASLAYGIAWDLSALVLGTGMGFYGPSLAAASTSWHRAVWPRYLGLALLAGLVLATARWSPLAPWIVLILGILVALAGVAAVPMPAQRGAIMQAREHPMLYAAIAAVMVLFAFAVRITRQTTIVWVLAGALLAVVLLVVLERRTQTRHLPDYLRVSMLFAALRSYAWLYALLCAVAMNTPGVLAGAVACMAAAAIIAPKLAARLPSAHWWVAIGCVGALVLVPGVPGTWMLPGTALMALAGFAGRNRVLEALHGDAMIPEAERRMVLARCEAFGALAQQWLALALLALGSFGLAQQPGAAVSAYAWHAGITEDVASIYRLSAALIFVGFVLAALALRRMRRLGAF